MANESVTLALEGTEIPLSTFADAMTRWRDLMDELSAQVAGYRVAWVVEDLEKSSAIATVVPVEVEPSIAEAVVRAYSLVGESLTRGQRPPYSPPVVRAAESLTQLINGHVEAIRFETPQVEWLVRASVLSRAELAVPLQAYGAVEGRIQTLSSRHGLRFALYDLIGNRAVSCYIAEGHEDLLRDAWGHRAIVEGWISRDPMTGRALSIRRVAAIEVVAEDVAGSYRDARGSVPVQPGQLLPEDAIRRLRDA